MEDQGSSTTLMRVERSSWIIGPKADLLFIANIAWPLLLLPGVSSSSETAVDFWQVYFVTLPHRWITLFLVSVDPDRRQGQTAKLAIAATIIAGVVAGSFAISHEFGTQAFICLGFVDYVWNGWHFAAQHAGILRIYSRKSFGSSNLLLEKWGLRSVILYTILRASSSLLWPQMLHSFLDVLKLADHFVLALAAIILVAAFLSAMNQVNRHSTTLPIPRLAYLTSVICLYASYLWASRMSADRYVLCLATAISLFHAVEYLAIVSHYATRRSSLGSPGLMRWLSLRWGTLLMVFMIVLGSLGVWFDLQSLHLNLVWQGLNLWAALTHYMFDGLIWKLRRSETAQALGAQ